jgi:hypothetical protein
MRGQYRLKCEGEDMAWLTFRNGFGEPQETNQCTHDCTQRLEAALELRKQKGFKVQKLSSTIYCVRTANDSVEIITVDDVMPDMPPADHA